MLHGRHTASGLPFGWARPGAAGCSPGRGKRLCSAAGEIGAASLEGGGVPDGMMGLDCGPASIELNNAVRRALLSTAPLICIHFAAEGQARMPAG